MTTTEEMRAAADEVDPAGANWNRDDCTSWCSDTPHDHDPACWGGEDVEHEVFLSMEEGFPNEAVEPYDPAWIKAHCEVPLAGVYAYRGQPGYREVVYLHLYRPSENKHLDLDCSVHLTGLEAVQLAHHLLRVASMIVDPSLSSVGVE